MRPNRLFKTLLCITLLASGTLTACGSDSSDGASDSGSNGASSSDSSPADALADAYAGVIGEPPTAATKAPAGGLAWVVSCGESVPTCATPTAAAMSAAEAAGMEAKLCDGKLNPQGWSDCIRQGISAKAAGIVVIGQDCASFQAALQEAQSANIPTIGAGGNDCDVTGGKKLFSAVVQNMPDMDAQQWWEKMGELQADWIIGKTAGKAQVLSTQFTDAVWGAWIQDGFTKQLETCSDCKVLNTVELSNQDLVSGQLAQKFQTALLKQPTANAVNVPIDGWFFAGLAQAFMSSGRNDQLAVIGAFGNPGNFATIAQNRGEDASVTFSAEWTGWAGVDALVRVLNGDDTQPAGIGLQVVDAENNMPEGDTPFAYDPAVDYQASYKAAWGLS